MAANSNNTNTAASASSNTNDHFNEQDRLLPIANVGRIMKQILPANAKISKEGKETMQECVSEFISFVTGEASDKCKKERRKTVNGDDICWAIETLGFDNYGVPLKRYLDRYREIEGDHRVNVNSTCIPERGGYNEEKLNEGNFQLFRDGQVHRNNHNSHQGEASNRENF